MSLEQSGLVKGLRQDTVRDKGEAQQGAGDDQETEQVGHGKLLRSRAVMGLSSPTPLPSALQL
jgi:hypothetical protein